MTEERGWLDAERENLLGEAYLLSKKREAVTCEFFLGAELIERLLALWRDRSKRRGVSALTREEKKE